MAATNFTHSSGPSPRPPGQDTAPNPHGDTERGLYCTLRRLTAAWLLTASEVAVPRAGAKRKDYELTQLGARYSPVSEVNS